MYAIAGIVILIVMLFGGFAIIGGALGPVMEAIPHEMLIIMGAALGALVTGNNMHGIKAFFGGFKKVMKGPRHTKQDHIDVIVLTAKSITEVENYPNRAGQTGSKALTIPRDAAGGPKEGGQRAKQVSQMQAHLQAKLSANPKLQRLAKQVRMIDTLEGIRIDLVDDADFSMFQLGTTVLTPDAAALLHAIGELLTGELGGVSIRGHTDALPWNGGAGANNWSLSAGRAEATRQALMADGIGEGRFRKIEGVAEREPLVRYNASDPRNRRISILLMR